VNDYVARIWKAAVKAHFKELPRHFSGRT